VRLDILERLADLIRPLVAWRSKEASDKAPPKGSTGDGGFTVTPDMMSILGCSPAELGNVLKALGFRLERKPAPKSEEAESKPFEEATAGPDTKIDEKPSEPNAEQLTTRTSPSADAAAAGTAAADDGGVAAEQSGGVEIDRSAGEFEATPQTVATDGDTSTPATAEIKPSEDAPVLDTVEQADAGAGGLSEPPSEEVADGAAAAVTTDGEAETETTDTIDYIEIWRPRRHRAEGDRNPRRGRGRRYSDAGQTARGESQQQDRSAQAGADQSSGRDDGDGRSRRSGQQGRPQNSKPPRQRAEGGKDRGSRPNRQGKQDAAGGRGRGRRPEFHSSGPKKSASVDPDSPFAALRVLKDALEKQDENEG